MKKIWLKITVATFSFFILRENIVAKPEAVITVDFFAMSKCPYTTKAEVSFYLLKRYLKDYLKFNLYFIAQKDKEGNFESLHGKSEVEEDIRQLLIRKYFPDKFWSYLMSRNTNYRGDEWQASAYLSGIDIEKLDYLYEKEGKKLLGENIKKALSLKIDSSPTIFINGKRYTGRRDFASLLLYCRNFLPSKVQSRLKLSSLPICFSSRDCISSGEIGVCQNPGTKNARCEPLNVELKLVDVDNLSYENDRIFRILRELLPSITPIYIPYNSAGGKRIINITKKATLPIYLISKNVKKLNLSNRVFSGEEVSYNNKKYLTLPTLSRETRFYLKREREPNTIAVFTMSYCPFGSEALREIIPIAKENNINLSIHYILKRRYPSSKKERPILRSLHGQKELDEDIRQVCARKYFPDRYLDYVYLRAKENNRGWENIAKEALGESSITAIKTCMEKEGKFLIEEDSQIAEELGITASPTILWENQRRYNNLRQLKENVPLFKNITLKREGNC